MLVKISKICLLFLFSACCLTLITFVLKTEKDNRKIKSVIIKENQIKKCLVYICEDRGCGGIADRIKGIMSVYALALMTDRKLIINMTFPCKLDKYLIPNEVDWSQTVPNSLKSIHYEINVDSINILKNAVDINQLWKNTDVVKIQTNLHILYSLSLNKNYHGRIKEIGYVFFLSLLLFTYLKMFDYF